MEDEPHWERVAYTTIQIRRFDKERLLHHAFPREPNWKTFSRILDILDQIEKAGGWLEIKKKLTESNYYGKVHQNREEY